VADLVIGADGIGSVVRAHLTVDEPRYSGLTVYRGLIPAARVPWSPRTPRIRIWLGPGQHCVAYPVARGDAVSVVAGVPSPVPGPGESWTRPGDVADLVAAYAGWHPTVVDLLAAAPAVTRWDLYERPTPRRWCTDRVALVGDAAHPMLPVGAQGANQAVEDAVALATCLAAVGGDRLSAALTAYEWVRVQRLDAVRAAVAALAADHHRADGPGQRERDRRLAGASLAGQRWLYGYDAELAAIAALETHRVREEVSR
jgi:salicylate hydroxylase